VCVSVLFFFLSQECLTMITTRLTDARAAGLRMDLEDFFLIARAKYWLCKIIHEKASKQWPFSPSGTRGDGRPLYAVPLGARRISGTRGIDSRQVARFDGKGKNATGFS
jgi:hypothetical protein